LTILEAVHVATTTSDLFIDHAVAARPKPYFITGIVSIPALAILLPGIKLDTSSIIVVGCVVARAIAYARPGVRATARPATVHLHADVVGTCRDGRVSRTEIEHDMREPRIFPGLI
jgi:hypothetical protein